MWKFGLPGAIKIVGKWNLSPHGYISSFRECGDTAAKNRAREVQASGISWASEYWMNNTPEQIQVSELRGKPETDLSWLPPAILEGENVTLSETFNDHFVFMDEEFLFGGTGDRI